MGLKDTVTTKYMRQNVIFADIFNYFIYNGEQVIDPDSLEELDTREVEVPYGGKDGAEQPVQKTRDVIKSLIAMVDRKTAYLVLAVENQSNVHYGMPVKNMVYDALQYARQVSNAAASHKRSGDYKESDGDEYLSGFMREERLLPVVTLVVYFDSKEWDGPMSIHEMFEEQDARSLALVPDYRINLITPASIEDGDFEEFQISLREVLAFIKYSQDADRLKGILEAGEGFRHLGRAEVHVLNACVGAKLTMEKREETIDVCLAIEQMKQQAVEEAAKKAAEKERVLTLLESIKNLMKNAGWSKEQCMDMLAVPESDTKEIMQLI